MIWLWFQRIFPLNFVANVERCTATQSYNKINARPHGIVHASHHSTGIRSRITIFNFHPFDFVFLYFWRIQNTITRCNYNQPPISFSFIENIINSVFSTLNPIEYYAILNKNKNNNEKNQGKRTNSLTDIECLLMCKFSTNK